MDKKDEVVEVACPCCGVILIMTSDELMTKLQCTLELNDKRKEVSDDPTKG